MLPSMHQESMQESLHLVKHEYDDGVIDVGGIGDVVASGCCVGGAFVLLWLMIVVVAVVACAAVDGLLLLTMQL